ncbi:MAG: YicC/YloC family endoribonuclease [Andreesenia angusta]|nr:YicC/YloC family endoribonuclease [Andreesenia angusta]
MTGYGRAEVERDGNIITVEIKSVNHRYCDIVTRFPRHMACLEDKIKTKIKKILDRGRIEIFLYTEASENKDYDIETNLSLARAYLDAIEELGRSLGIYSDITMDRFLNFPDIISPKKEDYDIDLIWSIVEDAVDTALDSLLEMRKAEGENLRYNIEKSLNEIEDEISQIMKYKEKLVIDYKKKLKERIEDLLEDKSILDENRLENEIVYYVDKSNITEELVRLESHIDQFRKTIESQKSMGKKLDFIIQEMNRETNTISSKSNNMDITNSIVEIKTKIEEIREQIQNVE